MEWSVIKHKCCIHYSEEESIGKMANKILLKSESHVMQKFEGTESW